MWGEGVALGDIPTRGRGTGASMLSMDVYRTQLLRCMGWGSIPTCWAGSQSDLGYSHSPRSDRKTLTGYRHIPGRGVHALTLQKVDRQTVSASNTTGLLMARHLLFLCFTLKSLLYNTYSYIDTPTQHPHHHHHRTQCKRCTGCVCVWGGGGGTMAVKSA